MRCINTNLLSGSISVKLIRKTDDKDGFTEFVYQYVCGRTHFDVYINKGKVAIQNL